MNIKEIKINKFPVVIFSDSHCVTGNIVKLQKLYPDNQLICLGDFTFLFDKQTKLNREAVEFQEESKIPTCVGNHEIAVTYDKFPEHNYLIHERLLNYLKNLPIGFKLVLPNGLNYLLFHQSPKEFWAFLEEKSLTKEQLYDNYPIDSNTKFILHGHIHRKFIVDYDGIKRISLGSLKYGEYALLTEKGIEFKKLDIPKIKPDDDFRQSE